MSVTYSEMLTKIRQISAWIEGWIHEKASTIKRSLQNLGGRYRNVPSKIQEKPSMADFYKPKSK